MMTGIVQTGFGAPHDVLSVAEVPTPDVAADGVLVRVHAASVHLGAVYVVRGLPRAMRPLYARFVGPSGVIGQSVAGTVEAVGPDVDEFDVGDEVFGWCRGGFAEYAATTAESLAPKPGTLTFEQAAAIGVSAFTALQGLRHGGLAAGQRVLVTGASGGVGTFAVQIATALGAEVTGVCSTRNLDMVRSIGANHVLDHTGRDVTDVDARYDLILDTAGVQPLRRMRRLLTDRGRMVAVGGTEPAGWFGGIGRPLGIGLTALFSRRQTPPFVSSETSSDLETVRDLAATGPDRAGHRPGAPAHRRRRRDRRVGAGHNRGTTVIVV